MEFKRFEGKTIKEMKVESMKLVISFEELEETLTVGSEDPFCGIQTDISESTAMKQLMKQAQKDVEQCFYELLDKIPNKEMVQYALSDMEETSALVEEGHYSYGDVELSVQRTLAHALQKSFGLKND